MVCLAEGKNAEAETEMAKTKSLMPQFRVGAQSGSELLVYVNGVCQGRAPVAAQFLPGRHLITVIRRVDESYSVFNKCGSLAAGRNDSLPAVPFGPARPIDQLALPPDLRNGIRGKLNTVVNSIGMQFVPIPAGTFLMGSPDADSEAGKRRGAAAPGPDHQAVLSGRL